MAENVSLTHKVQTASGAHLASYATDTVNCTAEIRKPEREGDYSTPYFAEVENIKALVQSTRRVSWY